MNQNLKQTTCLPFYAERATWNIRGNVQIQFNKMNFVRNVDFYFSYPLVKDLISSCNASFSVSRWALWKSLPFHSLSGCTNFKNGKQSIISCCKLNKTELHFSNHKEVTSCTLYLRKWSHLGQPEWASVWWFHPNPCKQ